MQNQSITPAVAIACGGTGGHLFPGLAVGQQLVQRGCAVTLLISPKEVDQLAAKAAGGMEVVTLPAVGFRRGGWIRFLRGCGQAYWATKKLFQARAPHAVLAMGGFTSVAPVWVGRSFGATTFLHESNTIPGKANRWLSRKVDQAFVGFPEAAHRLRTGCVLTTGTPVRPQFQPRDAAVCRQALGLEPQRRVLLVMGGSQGASAINELILRMLPRLADGASDWQLLHLAGANDAEKVSRACAAAGLRSVVLPFLAGTELALGAATVAVNRAGASSLAELAAVRVPSVLIPLPTAADNHQFHNARAYEATGAARLLEQGVATPENLMRLILELADNVAVRERMQVALKDWHSPRAAEQIADCMMRAITDKLRRTGRSPAAPVILRNHQSVLT